MQESKLYLVFEYLNMDLKKYLDSFVTGTYMDKNLVKSYCYQVSLDTFRISYIYVYIIFYMDSSEQYNEN